MRQGLLVAVWVLSACSPEDLAGLQPTPPGVVHELSHTVRVEWLAGAAKLTVTRQLRNTGADFETWEQHLLLPPDAVVTSLELGTNGRWESQGTLSLTEEANAKWDLLRRPGTAAPSLLGLLEWSYVDEGLGLKLFGVPPASTVELRLVVELPVTYEAGTQRFSYPLSHEAGELAPQFVDSGLDVREGPATEGEAATELLVTRGWATKHEVDARWASFPVDAERSVWRLELDVAAELGRVPVRPNVVFVVDASYTEGEEGIAAQLELLAPYLANVPDAQVEVVLFRRRAERLFGRFVPAADVVRELASVPKERLAPGNGSHLDEGVSLAATLLAGVGGPARMVALTDALLRDGFSNQATIDSLSRAPRDLVLHVVERGVAWGELGERRDDSFVLAPIATATGGVAFRITGHPEDPVLAADTMLGLVRPVRIDDFEVTSDETFPRFSSIDDQQREGVSVRLSDVDPGAPARVKVKGRIWARRFEEVLSIDPALERRLPGLAIGDAVVRSSLSDDEQRTMAFVAHAVSPFTSFFAAPPSAAPSTIGLDWMGEPGGLGMRGVSCGCCGTSSRCGLRRGRGQVNLELTLRELLAPGVAACAQAHGEASGATFLIETTHDEIVDVKVEATSDALAGCLTEAAWAVRLSDVFWAPHHSYLFSW
ncbi:MAG: vWA domain-containing protein [Myxococcaceae bacterium]